MAGTNRQRDAGEPGLQPRPFSKLARKIVLLAGEDGFVLSHCRALLAALRELAREVVVVARSSGRLGEIERLGAGVTDFDCRASLRNPARDALAAWELARILEAEDADAMHVIGVRPAALGGLALKLVAGPQVMVHLPTLDGLEPATGLARLYRPSPARLVAALVRRPASFVLLENPDDLAPLRAQGADPGARFAVLGGAGVDPDVYPVLPPSQSEMPIAAYIGRMTASSGVDVLMRAFDRVWARGVNLQLELVGEHASDAADATPPGDIAQWGLHPGVRRIEPVTDVREVWRRAEICLLPAVRSQGLPRALLEAAACGRALVVTDDAGGGHFVRDGVEGLVVPRGDQAHLAEALERLARDADLRARLGAAARLRVLQGFTEAHVKQTLEAAYLALLGSRPSA
ncbi:MAG: glycosyltransferase [Hyphomonadaceae bacterium]|nr:glycosyltransferase [Hyphomonadaceae bacterium]